MDRNKFLSSMGVAMAAGISLGMMIAPRKRCRSGISKALRAAGDLADNITLAMGK